MQQGRGGSTVFPEPTYGEERRPEAEHTAAQSSGATGAGRGQAASHPPSFPAGTQHPTAVPGGGAIYLPTGTEGSTDEGADRGPAETAS